MSNVTDMSEMFSRVTWFMQDIGGWDVGGVTNMSKMFYLVDYFSQDVDISSWGCEFSNRYE